jgi:fatty acyl-CoA reductase
MNVLQMAEDIYRDHPQEFRCFVHVSTSYVNSHLVLSPPEGYPVGSPIDEVLYPAAYDVNDFVSPTVDLNKPELLAAAARFPNMYAFSKHMVEHAIKEKRQTDMPIAIVRPAIVGSSWAEPQPGWIGSSQGCTSMMLACGLGLIKGVPMNSKLFFDMVPLDTVIDAILATPVCYPSLHVEKGSVAVVQAGTSTTHPMQITVVFRNLLAYFQDYPSTTKQVRRPDFTIDVSIDHFVKEMAWQKRVATWVSYLPCVGKMGDNLVKATRQCEKLVDVLPNFLSREFRFHAPNLVTMKDHLDKEGVLDKYAGLDQDKMDWDHYIQRYCYGLRKFLLNEKNAVLPATGTLQVQNRGSMDGKKSRPFTILGLVCVLLCILMIALNWEQSLIFVSTGLQNLTSDDASCSTLTGGCPALTTL